MGDPLSMDLISDLPECIIENILTRLPIREAIKTSFLSRAWRYSWSTITDLVFNIFDDNSVAPAKGRRLHGTNFANFVTKALLLHQGPIHKFEVYTPTVMSTPDIDRWLLYLSRKDIKELLLQVNMRDEYLVPSCLYNFRKLTRLELYNCKINLPWSFTGFSCLKSLSIYEGFASSEVINDLIAGCPVLEELTLTDFFDVSLSISAPNLKWLHLDGAFDDIVLENTQNLVHINISMDICDMMYTSDDSDEHVKRIPSSDLINVLLGAPRLKRLIGSEQFVKYLSLGLNITKLPITYSRLKTIELYHTCFDDEDEVLVLIRLITRSPKLRDFKLILSPPPLQFGHPEEDVMNIWKQGCVMDCKLEKLKRVKITGLTGVKNEIEFIKFLLANSPKLEVMTIEPYFMNANARFGMVVELLKLPRASSRSQILFHSIEAL